MQSRARLLATATPPHPIRSALGGEIKQADTTALLQAEVEGRPISTHAATDPAGPHCEGIARNDTGRSVMDEQGNITYAKGYFSRMAEWLIERSTHSSPKAR